jgi:hypothetical protein
MLPDPRATPPEEVASIVEHAAMASVPSVPRLDWIDWLRAAAIAGEFLFHTLRPYSAENWQVQPAGPVVAAPDALAIDEPPAAPPAMEVCHGRAR